MLFNKTEWSLSSLALQIKEVHLAGLYTNKISTPRPFHGNSNPATVKTKISYELNALFFFFHKKMIKDEFNTFLKHLIKLVKNFKTHCYVFFFLL